MHNKFWVSMVPLDYEFTGRIKYEKYTGYTLVSFEIVWYDTDLLWRWKWPFLYIGKTDKNIEWIEEKHFNESADVEIVDCN